MIDRTKLFDIILDNEKNTDEVLVRALEKEISKGNSYRHSEKDVLDACGLKRSNRDFSKLKENVTTTSAHAENLEDTLSKRELAILSAVLHKKVMSLVDIIKQRSLL